MTSGHHEICVATMIVLGCCRSMVSPLLMMLVFWGVIIVGFVLGIRWLMTQGREPRRTDAALDILRQRYARGDISKEEFEAKKKDLA